jgi:hypothetical protein
MEKMRTDQAPNWIRLIVAASVALSTGVVHSEEPLDNSQKHEPRVRVPDQRVDAQGECEWLYDRATREFTPRCKSKPSK